MPSNNIYGILEDNSGKLWISTSNGLSRFNPQTEKFKNFDFRDGLQHNTFNARAHCKGRNGYLIFGGIRGLNIFQPEMVTDNSFPPPVAITAFKKFNRVVKTGTTLDEADELKLSYKDYSFSFEFTDLDFHVPEKNVYAYMMEGFDNNWIITDYKKREANYSNLTPGEYTFRVKVSNNSGVWKRGEHGNHLFIAMEFLEGKLLSDYIKSEIRLPVDESAGIILQLMGALAWIHEKGIPHRDLKPENVMLVHQEGAKHFVKLLDFGLAKTESLTRLTQSGTLIGTINYLSPEYVRGRYFSKASDIYALGIIFYEMITGEQPFEGETTLEIMKKIIGKAPKEPREYCQELSPVLNQLIMDLMAKKPYERPGLKDAIQRISSHFSTTLK